MVKKILLAILVLWHGTCSVPAEDCSTSRVRNLSVSDDAILTWEPMPADDCIIDFYLVYIKSGANEEKLFNMTETTMDVSFMTKCTTAQFIVIPVSPEGVEGSNFLLITTMPLPPDVNLTVTYVRVSPEDGGILLEWGVDEEWRGCVRFYRIVVYDEISDSPEDIYSSFPSVSVPLIPCATYDIGVKALYNIQAEGPVSLVRYTTPPVKLLPPVLRSVTLGTTSVQMTWSLEEYAQNRCAVSYFIVDSSPLFNITYSITDQPSRPPVSVRVNNLQTNTMYLLNVTVSNTAGSSKPMLVAVQTLDVTR